MVLKILPFLKGERKGRTKKATCVCIQFQRTTKQHQDSYPNSKARFFKEEEWGNPDQAPTLWVSKPFCYHRCYLLISCSLSHYLTFLLQKAVSITNIVTVFHLNCRYSKVKKDKKLYRLETSADLRRPRRNQPKLIALRELKTYDFPILRISPRTVCGICEKPKYPSPFPHPSTLILKILLKNLKIEGYCQHLWSQVHKQTWCLFVHGLSRKNASKILWKVLFALLLIPS